MRRRAVVDPKIAENHGRIVKTTGDGLLVEFPSVVDAVRCAVQVQRSIAERKAGVPIASGSNFVSGSILAMSSVIVEDDDIYGDGVNVAARLESLAEPGGVFISNIVYEEVRDPRPVALRVRRHRRAASQEHCAPRARLPRSDQRE